jgi:hypothetical protein
MSSAKACPHLNERLDLDVLFVLDSHIQLTDAFVRCRHCGATFLIEMADMDKDVCVFRMSGVPADAANKTIRSLQKGSCDINRARNEVFSLASSKQPCDALLLMRAGQFAGVVASPPDVSLPNRSWRELPCDGALIRDLGLRA